MSDVIILVERTWEVDDIGQRVSKETEREVFCEIGNISRSEWNAAVSTGMKHGKYHFNACFPGFVVDTYRNTSAVISYTDDITWKEIALIV